MKRIWKWLVKKCDEYLEEEEFEEVWFERFGFGFGIERYKRGGIGIEIWNERFCVVSIGDRWYRG